MNSRHQRRFGHLLTFLVIVFVLVNLFSLLALFQLMPQRDFGVLYYSARAFLDGTNMYGLSPAAVTRLDNGLELQAWNMNPPHFHLLLLPLALRRRWRALLTATAVFFACYALGLLVFGLDNHLSWIDRLRIGSGSAWLPSNGSILGLLRRTFAPSPFFTPLLELPDVILKGLWVTLGALAGLLTLHAACKAHWLEPDAKESPHLPGLQATRDAHTPERCGSPESVDRSFALLLTGALLISPLGWVYYY